MARISRRRKRLHWSRFSKHCTRKISLRPSMLPNSKLRVLRLRLRLRSNANGTACPLRTVDEVGCPGASDGPSCPCRCDLYNRVGSCAFNSPGRTSSLALGCISVRHCLCLCRHIISSRHVQRVAPVHAYGAALRLDVRRATTSDARGSGGSAAPRHAAIDDSGVPALVSLSRSPCVDGPSP